MRLTTLICKHLLISRVKLHIYLFSCQKKRKKSYQQVEKKVSICFILPIFQDKKARNPPIFLTHLLAK